MKSFIGAIIIYLGVIVVIPYLLSKYAPFSVFITWFANVDIVANILSINWPKYFENVYDISPDTVMEYLSYNTISLVALSGIFIYGLRQDKKNNFKTLIIMMIMSILTWTLPTKGIPFVNKKIDEYIVRHNDHIDDVTFKREKLLITIIVSLCFIFVEWFIINYFVGSIDFNIKLPAVLRNV